MQLLREWPSTFDSPALGQRRPPCPDSECSRVSSNFSPPAGDGSEERGAAQALAWPFVHIGLQRSGKGVPLTDLSADLIWDAAGTVLRAPDRPAIGETDRGLT